MASRQFRSGISFGSLVPNMRVLTGVLDGTSDGYGEIVDYKFNGVASVQWQSTGVYKLILEDKYVDLTSVQLTGESPTAVILGSLVAHDVTAAVPYVTVLVTVNGSLADIPDTGKLHITLVLRDSTVKI